MLSINNKTKEIFMITPKIGTKTYNELEAIDESYDFDLDLSDAEFDYDEI